jgi:hypothetical protein
MRLRLWLAAQPVVDVTRLGVAAEELAHLLFLVFHRDRMTAAGNAKGLL